MEQREELAFESLCVLPASEQGHLLVPLPPSQPQTGLHKKDASLAQAAQPAAFQGQLLHLEDHRKAWNEPGEGGRDLTVRMSQ